jgi:hypothetical protein
VNASGALIIGSCSETRFREPWFYFPLREAFGDIQWLRRFLQPEALMSLLHSTLETLESRTLFAAVSAAAPDLAATALVARLPAAAAPGTKLKAKVRVANAGAAMAARTPVQVGLFVTRADAPAAGDEPFATVTVPMRLGAQQARNYTLRFNLPDALPADSYRIVVEVNVDDAVIEGSVDNNVVASSFLANPIGHYTGEVLVGGDNHVPFEFDLTQDEAGRIRTTLLGGGAGLDLFSMIQVSDVAANLSRDGHYHARARGNSEGSGGIIPPFTFTVAASGQIVGQTMSGTVTVHARPGGGGSLSESASFTVTKDS